MNQFLPNDIELKLLGAEDAAQLRAIAIKAYMDHYADSWYDNGTWYMQNHFSIARLQEELADKHARFYFIYHKSILVGFIKLNLRKPLPNNKENAVELERIYLLRSASGKGIGTFVLDFILDIARNQQAKLVWLKAMDTSQDAVRFYEKAGFEICGTHQVDYVQKREGMRGMHLMRKNL